MSGVTSLNFGEACKIELSPPMVSLPGEAKLDKLPEVELKSKLERFEGEGPIPQAMLGIWLLCALNPLYSEKGWREAGPEGVTGLSINEGAPEPPAIGSSISDAGPELLLSIKGTLESNKGRVESSSTGSSSKDTPGLF